MQKIDFQAVNLAAMNSFEQLLREWLPGGHCEGHEYKSLNPTRSDSKIGSFSISVSKGVWEDFATGDHGADPISLCAYLFHNNEQGRAARDLAERFGILPKSNSSKKTRNLHSVSPEISTPPKTDDSIWEKILPAPADAGVPPAAHIKRGKPEMSWTYFSGSGEILGFVYRFRTSDGGKETLPVTWCKNRTSGHAEWRWISFPDPRPLYGLDRLAAKPDATVLLVEGEKCADAGGVELPDLVVVSWPGGARADGKVDWAPLAGRKVITWADCDSQRERLSPQEKADGIDPHQKPFLPKNKQPGYAVMDRIRTRLLTMDCKLWDLTISDPGEKPDGWDIANAIDDGLKGSELSDYIRGNSIRLAPANLAQESISTAGMASAGIEFTSNDDAWRYALISKDDKLIDCRENVYLMLKSHPQWAGLLAADEFARKIVKTRPTPWDVPAEFRPGKEWGEDDDLQLGLWLAQSERMLVRRSENLASAVGWVARESKFHPVRDYLESLHWDGVPRLSGWVSDFLGVKKSEYSALSGQFALIGMVARIFDPGCQMRFMPILEGQQYRGKSSALRVLAGQWFGDTAIDLNNKDSYQLIQGCWLYEIAELDAFNRAESTRIKAFVSSQTDKFRAPYERAPKDCPRATVFFGTTNQDEYFKDQTGNTRYWPWRCNETASIDLVGLAAARDQLFAEAVHLYHQKTRWHPTRDEQINYFDPEQTDREISDPWQSIITTWLRSNTRIRITATDVLTDCLKIEAGKIDSGRQMSTRVGIAMKRIGWLKKRESWGDREYYYTPPAGWNDVKGVGDATF